MSPASSAPETVLDIVHEHWIRYVLPSFIYVLLSGCSLMLFYIAGATFTHEPQEFVVTTFVAGLALFSVTHHWYFFTLLERSETCIIITSRRIVRVRYRLFLEEEMLEIAYDKMKYVKAENAGLIQTLLRYGTLHFEKMASVPFVPHPSRVASRIERAMGMK